MKSSLAIFTQINKNSLYLAIFLIPIFFLPFAQSILDYPKQILFLVLIFLSLIGWLGRQFIQGKIILKENKLLYFTLFFIFVFFSLSAIFSLWPAISFFGWPLSTTDTVISLFSFLLLVFLFGNTFQNKREIFLAFFFLLISGAISGLFFLFQLYGLFILPFAFSKIASFNTLGSPYQAALFLAVLLPISLVLSFQMRKPVFWLIFLILLASIILIDFNSAWILLLLGILTLIIFGANTPEGKIRFGFLIVLMVLLVLSIFFLFFPLRFAGFPVLPLQVLPGIVSEIEILKGLYSEGIKNVLLGSGPGTFIFDYSKYRSPILNQTIFWGTRFSSGSSEFFDWFITKGLLGGISLLFFLGLIIYFAIKGVFKIEAPNSWFEGKLVLLASVIPLIGAGFLTPFSFSLAFLFWLIIAGLLFYHSKERVIRISSQSRRIVFSTLSLFFLILCFILLLFQGKNYLAETNYSHGIRLSQQGNLDQAINFLNKAVLFNPLLDIYFRDLAQLYLAKANTIAQDQKLAPEEKRRLIQLNINNGIQSLNQAIALAPFNIANWNVRGFFYRNLIGLPMAGEIALESYTRAIELEPSSPFSYGEMARVHILMAQNFRERKMENEEKQSLSLAFENLEKSIQLKSDYAPAHYLMAIAYDQQGRGEEAMVKLEEIKQTFPQDIGISFQLGMLYWRKEKLQESQKEFEGIIKLNPDYSNARYMLGLIYDKKGEKEKAKEQFEKVAKLNPENEEVKKILRNLEQGLPALEGIIPAQPPIGEAPPEIKE